MFIGIFYSPVSNATDRKTKNHAHGAVSSSSEFLSLTLFVSQLLAVLAMTLIGCFVRACDAVNSYIFMAILPQPSLPDSSDHALPLVKYKGLPAPVTRFQIPAHFHCLCLGRLVDGKLEVSRSSTGWIPSGDHSQSLL